MTCVYDVQGSYRCPCLTPVETFAQWERCGRTNGDRKCSNRDFPMCTQNGTCDTSSDGSDNCMNFSMPSRKCTLPPTPPPPLGSWSSTCKATQFAPCEWNWDQQSRKYNTFTCPCRKVDGNMQTSKMSRSICGTMKLANVNGNLTCSN